MSTLQDFIASRRPELENELRLIDAKVGERMMDIARLHADIAMLQTRATGLRSELAALDKAAVAIGMRTAGGMDPVGEPRRPRAMATIKEAVLEVLAEAPNGLIAVDILKMISTPRFGLNIERTSLSPQLSRLK